MFLFSYRIQSLSNDELHTAFLKAAQFGLVDAARQIYDTIGSQVLTYTDEDNYSALHRASYNGHVPVVEYLLKVGARVDVVTADGWQPLHSACQWNKAHVASLLLQNGAVVNSLTNGKQTPLHLASSNHRAKETLELLLMHPDIDPALCNNGNETAYELASRHGRCGYLFEVVEECVDFKLSST